MALVEEKKRLLKLEFDKKHERMFNMNKLIEDKNIKRIDLKMIYSK